MLQFLATLVAALALVVVAPAGAALIELQVEGKAGLGLLTGNENPAVIIGGSGGLGVNGIVLDTVTRGLSLDLVWGSMQGVTDLTGPALSMHIHGITSSAAPQSFLENAPVIIDLSALPGFNSSASDGGFVGTVVLANGTEELAAIEGRLYVNVHTAQHAGGEIRGNIVPVPEPGSLALVGGALLVLAAGRRRSR